MLRGLAGQRRRRLLAAGAAVAILAVALRKPLGRVVLTARGQATLLKWRATEGAKIEALAPSVRAHARRWLDRARAEGLPVVVTNTIRTPEEQAEKLQQGRSATGAPGWHAFGRALDFAVVSPRTGAVEFDVDQPEVHAIYARAGQIAEQVGFRWLGFKVLKIGDGRTFTDPYHIEWRDGMTVAEARRRWEAAGRVAA